MSKQTESTSEKPRIAIAGATGRVGSMLINLLSSDPVNVIALTRRPDAAKLPKGVTATAIAFDQPQTIADALRGADRLFISHGSSPQQVANEIALIDGAVAAGIKHITKLSAMGPATRLYPLVWHMEIEAHLSRQPIASSVLRPSAFADILGRRAGAQVSTGSWTGAAGNGRVNFIDTRDVAAAARITLLDDVYPESQRVYHLTGPRAWTMPQIAEELSNLLGHSVVYKNRSPDEERTALLAAGLSPFVTDLLLGLDRMFRESVIAETTSTVEELTGKPPRTLQQWLIENIEVFRK
jgi:NAD(P)H dehydrogenase (quinone)